MSRASLMIPFRFGPLGEQLFGVYHPAANSAARLAVLLCNPFGQEAIRVHRLYRMLAERLAKAGIASMRFDYIGTGESDGDDLDGHLQRWCADIHLADRELRQRSDCDQRAWVGARLGGTLAWLAIQSAYQSGNQDTNQSTQKAPASLLLWEPVLNGSAYLRSLALDHVKAIASPYRLPVEPAGDRPIGEALGFAMSTALIEQIAQIGQSEPAHGSPPASAHAWRLDVMAPPDDAAAAAWVASHQRSGRACQLLPFEQRFDWTSEEAMNTALVPPAALQLLSKTLEGLAS